MRLLGSKNELYTAPVAASRGLVFAPTTREPKTDVVVSGRFGKARISGDIGLTHRRLLDAAFTSAIEQHQAQTGQLALLVDPYRLAKSMGAENKKCWLESLFEDMRKAKIEGVGKDGEAFQGGIISEWRDAKDTRPMPAGALQPQGGAVPTERTLKVLIISHAWMRIYNSELLVNYKPLLPKLNKIRCAAAYAIALLVLTHREYNKTLDEALTEVGALALCNSERARRKLRQDVLEEAGRVWRKKNKATGELEEVVSDHFAELGIEIRANGVVFYRQHDEVRFRAPKAECISVGSERISVEAEPISVDLERISVESQEIQENQEGQVAAANAAGFPA